MLFVSSIVSASLIIHAVVHVYCEDTEEDGGDHRSKDDEDQAHEFTEDQLRQAHAEVDRDSDGKVTHQELMDFARSHHRDVLLSETDTQQELNRLDTSKDGHISLEEHLSDKFGTISEEERVDEAEKFKAADTNQDGLLDKAEFLGLLAPEEHADVMNVTVRQRLRQIDTDADGKLNFEEFKGSGLAYSEYAPHISSSPDTQHMEDEEVIKMVFAKLDKDADGLLDHKDLRDLLSGRLKSEEEVKSFMKAVDENGNTHVEAGELVKGKNSVYDSDLQSYLMAWARRRSIIGR